MSDFETRKVLNIGGDSLGIVIPADYIDALAISEGDIVKVYIVDGKINVEVLK